MIGISLAVYGVTNIFTQAVLVGVATKRLGERTTAVVALGLNVASFVLTGLCTRSWMVFAVILVSAPGGVSLPAMQAWMSKMTPADAQGRLQGTIGGAEGLASIIGPIVMTQTFGHFEHSMPGAPFYLAAVLTAVALVFAVRAAPPGATT